MEPEVTGTEDSTESTPVEQTQEAPVEESTQDEQHEPEQPTPEPETDETTEVVEEESDDLAPNVPQLQAVDATQFVDPESGVFDVNAYNQAMIATQQQTIQTATAQIRAELEYKGQWDKAISEFPELKDAKIRDMVAAYHIQQSNNGKYMSPQKAAKAFFGYSGRKVVEAKQEGVREATETTRVQASAHLESAGGTVRQSDTVSDLKARLADSRDPSERSRLSQQVLKELIKSGKL